LEIYGQREERDQYIHSKVGRECVQNILSRTREFRVNSPMFG
jgi:hypothetical protein